MNDEHEQVELARELLQTVRHAALATVNEDGSPHNTPYLFMRNNDFTRLYWGSHEGSLHTQNIERTGHVFVAVFNSSVKNKGGIYITAVHARQAVDDEFVEALAAHNELRVGEGSQPLDESFYLSDGTGQHMYIADVEKIELYSSRRNADGLIVEEVRKQIDPAVLLGRVL